MASTDHYNFGRLEPCHLVNPDMWRAYCALVGRYPDTADHWTEYDVIAALRAREARQEARREQSQA